jgi:DUF4097 and DUF4098 domain-containing protein YvlB
LAISVPSVLFGANAAAQPDARFERSFDLSGPVELDAAAGSGSIAVTGQPKGEWNLTTGSGSIHLRISSQAAFDLEARTGSGGISTDHPLTVRGAVERKRLSGQVRGGVADRP